MANDQQNDLEQTESSGGPGIMGLIKGAAIISVIVIAEVVGAAILIPSARDTEQLGKQLVAAEAGQVSDEEAENQASAIDHPIQDVREVDLGKYNVTRYNPNSGATLTIDIQLFGAVLADEEADFNSRFEKNRGRVGEQVVLTLHAAEASDLTDAGLGLIKRKILEKTNRALGKPLVREVFFSQFNFVER